MHSATKRSGTHNSSALITCAFAKAVTERRLFFVVLHFFRQNCVSCTVRYGTRKPRLNKQRPYLPNRFRVLLFYGVGYIFRINFKFRHRELFWHVCGPRQLRLCCLYDPVPFCWPSRLLVDTIF